MIVSLDLHANYHNARKVHNYIPYCSRQPTKKNPFGSAYEPNPANGGHHTVKFSWQEPASTPTNLEKCYFRYSKFPSIVSAAEITRSETDVRTIGKVSSAASLHSRMRQLRRYVTSPTPRLTVSPPIPHIRRSDQRRVESFPNFYELHRNSKHRKGDM